MKRHLIEAASRVLAHIGHGFDAAWDCADRWLAERWWDTLEDWERDELTERGN